MNRGGSKILGFLSLAASVPFFGNILSGSLDLLCEESRFPETPILERPRGGRLVNSRSRAKTSSHTY